MEADELWRIDSCPAVVHVVLKEKTDGTNKACECTEVIKIFTNSPVLFHAWARVAHLPPPTLLPLPAPPAWKVERAYGFLWSMMREQK